MSRRIEFLNYHPAAPRQIKVQKLPPRNSIVRRPRQKRHETQNANNLNTSMKWQIEWINTYDALKKDSEKKVQQERQQCEQSMAALKEKLIESKKQMKSKMKTLLKKRQIKIRQLKMKIKLIQMRAEKETIERNGNGQMSPSKKLDQNIQTNEGDCDEQLTVSKDYIKNIHSYARPYFLPSAKLYKCNVCQFQSEKKSSLDDHNETHAVPVNDMTCPICLKSFNYRRLRLHFNYFISQLKKTGNDDAHKPTGAHGKFGLAFHENLATEHKRSKPNK